MSPRTTLHGDMSLKMKNCDTSSGRVVADDVSSHHENQGAITDEVTTRMTIRRVPGTALATNTGEIIYTPPVGEDLLAKPASELGKVP